MADQYRPNVVFIITDQQRYDSIAALGFDHIETPNIDRLVDGGTAFTNCFIPAPSCCPSRASLFQGQYPHTTGVYKNGDTWTTTWVSRLAEVGYRCVNVGKMHTVPFGTDAGFHERYIVENKDRFLEGRYYFDEWDKALRARGLVKQQRELYRARADYRERMGAFAWELDADMQSDNFVGGFAEWWLRTYPTGQPLFMTVGFPGPHPPYDPTPDWLEKYLNKDLPIREFSADEIDAQPEALRALRRHMIDVDHDSVVHLENPSREQLRFQRAAYLANVSMIDEQVGRIVAALDASGRLDDTVIVFTSDHGDSLGDHGHSQKWTMYEEIVHVPAVVWMGTTARERFSPRPGERVDDLVSLFDLGPTMLELAGVPADPEMEAVSLVPLITSRAGSAADAGAATAPTENAPAADAAVLAGTAVLAEPAVSLSDSTWDVATGRPPFVNADGSREYVFAEHGRDNILDATDVMTMVRDRRWKAVTFSGDASGGRDGQLFDLQTDSDERRNLWADPAAAAEKARLLGVLHAWHRDSAYHTRTRRRE